MKLTLKERLVLPRLYPQKGNLLSQITIRDINEKIKVDKIEVKKVSLKSNPKGGLTWDSKKAKDKTIDFTEVELNFLKDQVTRLDKEENVTPDILDLCLKVKNYEKRQNDEES